MDLRQNPGKMHGTIRLADRVLYLLPMAPRQSPVASNEKIRPSILRIVTAETPKPSPGSS